MCTLAVTKLGRNATVYNHFRKLHTFLFKWFLQYDNREQTETFDVKLILSNVFLNFPEFYIEIRYNEITSHDHINFHLNSSTVTGFVFNASIK